MRVCLKICVSVFIVIIIYVATQFGPNIIDIHTHLTQNPGKWSFR